jgi:hypothetical protein
LRLARSWIVKSSFKLSQENHAPDTSKSGRSQDHGRILAAQPKPKLTSKSAVTTGPQTRIHKKKGHFSVLESLNVPTPLLSLLARDHVDPKPGNQSNDATAGKSLIFLKWRVHELSCYLTNGSMTLQSFLLNFVLTFLSCPYYLNTKLRYHDWQQQTTILLSRSYTEESTCNAFLDSRRLWMSLCQRHPRDEPANFDRAIRF